MRSPEYFLTRRVTFGILEYHVLWHYKIQEAPKVVKAHLVIARMAGEPPGTLREKDAIALSFLRARQEEAP